MTDPINAGSSLRVADAVGDDQIGAVEDFRKICTEPGTDENEAVTNGK